MSDNSNEQKFLSELDGDLHQAVRKVRNVAVDELAAEQAVAKMQQLVVEAAAANGNHRRKATPVANTIKWVGGIAASALIAFGIFNLVSQPKLSLAAQVARAIAAEDWVRAIESFTDGGEMETWFSTARNISALSNSERVEYRDHDEGVSYEFFRKDQTIYRVSESEVPRQYSEWSKLVTRLPMLLADGLPDEPVTTIFGEDVGERITFVAQNIAPSPDGHELEYAIQCLLVDDSPMEIVLYLDPETKLPLRCLMTGIFEGKEMTNTIELDYPDSGPRNIYDLGVPVDAKLVNRVETEQVKFLLEAVKAGITIFDDYRAIMVKHRIGDKVWWRNADVEVVCRKGECFSRSFASRSDSKIEPDKDADMHAWWEKQIELSEEDPNGRLSSLAIGDQIWAVDANEGTFEKRRHPNNGYHCWSLRPDMIARPPMGGSSATLEIRIDENPKTGPPRTILFELFRTDSPNVSRYWIDPERGYLVVQMEMGTDKAWSHQEVVEKAAQSPSGIWYPQRLSTKWKSPDGNMYEDETNCYVDFEAELPDQLFKVK